MNIQFSPATGTMNAPVHMKFSGQASPATAAPRDVFVRFGNSPATSFSTLMAIPFNQGHCFLPADRAADIEPSDPYIKTPLTAAIWALQPASSLRYDVLDWRGNRLEKDPTVAKAKYIVYTVGSLPVAEPLYEQAQVIVKKSGEADRTFEVKPEDIATIPGLEGFKELSNNPPRDKYISANPEHNPTLEGCAFAVQMLKTPTPEWLPLDSRKRATLIAKHKESFTP